MRIGKIKRILKLSNSKIELIDYEKVSVLSNIEESKSNLKMKIEYVMNFAYANVNEKGSDKKQITKLLVSELMVTEKDIQKDIKKVINE